VIPASFDYLRPETVAEALEMTRLDEATMFLAGGHALLPERKLRHTAPRTVIDLGRIADLRGIDILEDRAPAHAGGNSASAGAVRRTAASTRRRGDQRSAHPQPGHAGRFTGRG
jgi:carbon-monoxide dehydrogenase medium subunit